jgi:putative intracellular protease/amidase
MRFLANENFAGDARDRAGNLLAAVCGAGGALAAALLAELFIRTRRRRAG